MRGLLKIGQWIIIRINRTGQGGFMNEKFYALPKEKQEKIINAGFRVFSQNSYKKSPMSEIADAAGISKSLLFHYFHNKKELYLFISVALAINNLYTPFSKPSLEPIFDFGHQSNISEKGTYFHFLFIIISLS